MKLPLFLLAACRNSRAISCVFLVITVLSAPTALVFSQPPPVLNTVFPVGGQVGKSVEVTVGGTNLETLTTLHCSSPGVRCERLDPARFRLTIPADAQPGLHDMWAVGSNGISSPRTFAIGRLTELVEAEPKESTLDSQLIPLESVINGLIDKAGDVDPFRFEAKKGQRVLIECWAERIDSRLRAVMELYDSNGRRAAVNRSFFATDPFIAFTVPADGVYTIKLQDLISSGSPEHYYRLDIHTGPRAVFTVPTFVQRGKTSRVSIYGWNLGHSTPSESAKHEPSDFERVEVELPALQAKATWPLPVLLHPSQAVLAGAAFPYYLPGSHVPILIGLSDASVREVMMDANVKNHSPRTAQKISAPCDFSGQLAEKEQCDWFAVDARRGEAFVIEALGQRISSPVDLQITIHERLTADQTDGEQEGQAKLLTQFGDEPRNLGSAFSTSHLDPAGRWVSSSDNGFLIAVKNLSGGKQNDARRIYRLSIRRDEPDFQVLAVGQHSGPTGLNVQRGGRATIELMAIRRRGWQGPIRVTAKELPTGIECPDVWFGPNTDRAMLIISAGHSVETTLGELNLEAHAEFGDQLLRNDVVGGAVVRSGKPTGWGRLVSKIPFAISGSALLRITANGHEAVRHQLYGTLQVRHSPGGMVDLSVQVEQGNTSNPIPLNHPIKLVGVGLSEWIPNETALLPAGQTKGYLSFHLPTTLATGHYTFAVRAETRMLMPNSKEETVVFHSNPVTINVQPAAFVVETDPFAVKRARRGETIQVAYSSRRLNGFIGKMHTELMAPGRITNVEGLRGRGETFVGQTETGTLQIIVTEDAPLGPQRFLRLFTVGVVEDEPIYQGSSQLSLEILE